MEIFMDDFTIFGRSFEECLNNLENVLKRCVDQCSKGFWPQLFLLFCLGFRPEAYWDDAKSECLLVSVAKDRSQIWNWKSPNLLSWYTDSRGFRTLIKCFELAFELTALPLSASSYSVAMVEHVSQKGFFCSGTRLVVVILQWQWQRFPMAVSMMQSRASRRWCSFSSVARGGCRRRKADLVRKTEQQWWGWWRCNRSCLRLRSQQCRSLSLKYGSERVAAAWFRVVVARGGLTSRWLPVWLCFGGVAQRRKNQFAIWVRAEKMNSAGFANLDS